MIAIPLALLLVFASAPAWSETLFYEPFNYPNGALSGSHPVWNTTSGTLTIDNGEARTNSGVFRVITRETFRNVAVTFRLRNLGLTTSSGEAWHGVHMFLRYQSQYHLYAVTINRRDNRVVIKKKVPGGSSNGGTYYDLGWGSFSVPYGAWQDVRALARNNADGTVSVELYVNGALLVSGRDTGQGGSPITAAGYTGVRSDYTSLRFDDFRVDSLDAPAPAPAPSDPSCLISAGSWSNGSLTAQSGAFTASFEAVPGAAGMDGVVGLSKGAAAGYASLAAAVRFNSSGLIDARNGSAYGAAAAVPYAAGTAYLFRLEVDLASKTYDAYVKSGTASEQLLAQGFAFRTEQATVASLDNIGLYASSGSEEVCGHTASAKSDPGDATPPAVSITAPADGAEVSGIVTVSASASDDVGVAGVRFKLDGADLGAEDSAPPYEIVWDSAQAAEGPHTLTAVARDAAGNEASSSLSVSVGASGPAPAPAPGDPACLVSAGSWTNGPLASQGGHFTARFEAVPGASGMDGVIGLSRGQAADYSALAAAVRFNSEGRIDARNGGEYSADSAVSYVPLTTYYFRLEVNLPGKTYDAYVKPGPSSEQALARKFAFRLEQASVPSLDNIALLASSGSETVCAAAALAKGGGKGLTPREGEARALERFLSPALADGINDIAAFGPEADEVTVFDTRGRQVYKASKGGTGGSLTWDARDPKGRIVRAGVYIVRIKTRDGETLYQSLAVVK